MEKLTRRQEQILDYLKSYSAQHGYPPAIREIGKEVGLSSPATIHAHLKNIEDKGYIKRVGTKNRAIELLVKNEFLDQDSGVVEVPLLGMVTAGSPIEAIERPDEYFSLPTSLIPKRKEVFTLEVKGESMINAGIFDGDQILVQEQSVANNGDMVVALVEDSATVKTFYKEDGYYRLQPENDTMDPIIVHGDLKILGKVIGVFRFFS